MRLIDVDEALRLFNREYEETKELIHNVHWDDDPDTYGADCGPKGKCMKSFETMCADDFCSYGERKDVGDG